MFGRPPEGGLLSFCVGWLNGLFKRAYWASLTCASAALSERSSPCSPKTRTVACAHLRVLAILCGRKTRGVLPENGRFSSNECTLGRTPRSGVGVEKEKPQVNALRLRFENRSMFPMGCHVDENHPISGMLRGSKCITARGTKTILLQRNESMSSIAATGV